MTLIDFTMTLYYRVLYLLPVCFESSAKMFDCFYSPALDYVCEF